MTARYDALPARSPRVLADALPGGGIIRDAALVISFAALIGLSAQVAVPLPFTPVPITGQTFAVLFGAVVLGRNRAVLGSGIYLAGGVAGVPWFTPAAASTYGYLIGFVMAAAVVGAIAGRGWARRPHEVAATMMLGNLIIYAFGVTYLSAAIGVGVREALTLGLVPFLAGDLVKIALGTLLVPGAWRTLERI